MYFFPPKKLTKQILYTDQVGVDIFHNCKSCSLYETPCEMVTFGE